MKVISTPAPQRAIRLSDTTVENLTLGAVVKIVQLSKTRIYTLMKQGRFPQSHRVLTGAARWKREAVEAWANGTWQP